MNTLSKSLLSVSLVLVLALAGLWLREQKVSSLLTAQLAATRESQISLEADLKGLQEANAALHKQVAELRAAPPLFTAASQQAVAPALPPAQDPAAEAPQAMARPPRVQRGEDDAERQPRELTPEEQAERDRRIQEWNQRREEFRQRIVNEVQDRKAFFAQVSTEGLAPEYKASHERLLQVMGELENSMNALANPDLTREERRDIMRSMGQVAGEVRDLMSKQREILLHDYATQALGLNAEATKQFIDYMQTINQMTTPAPMGPIMGGGGRPGGGPPRDGGNR